MNASIDITNVAPFLVSLAASGVGVVLLAQVIKKLFGMSSDAFIHLMVVLVSGLGALASYILQYKNLPPEVLGVSGPAIYGFSQGLYKTVKILSDLLPRISAALHKPVAASATAAANQAVAAVGAPADIAAEPSASNNNEFSA